MSLLFVPKLILETKKHFSSLDNILAIRRNSLDSENYSLYPKQKNMGFIAEIMEKKLKENGVSFELSNKTKIYNQNKLIIKTDNSTIGAEKIFLAILYILVSVILCIIAAYSGYNISRIYS